MINSLYDFFSLKYLGFKRAFDRCLAIAPTFLAMDMPLSLSTTTIGYHSYSHTLHSYLSSSKITSDFNATNKLLKEMTGVEFTVWRAPGGDISPSILKAIPLPHIMWSVDTRDWETQSTDSNYWYITRAKDGDIILLHDLYSPSVNGAIRAMKDMIAGDYEFVTVTELLSRDGTPPENCTNYLNG